MKRFTIILLSAALLLTLAACGGSSDSGKNNVLQGVNCFMFRNEDSVALEEPSAPLNAQQIYNQMTYTPQMFYGKYSIVGGDSAEEAYAQNMVYIDYTTEYHEKLTAIPYAIEAGPATLSHVIGFDKTHNWLRAYYYTESGNLTFFFCAYTIEGNTLTLKPLDDETYNYNDETGRLSYSFREEVFTYEFSFKGLELTLSQGDQSVTMRTGRTAYDDGDSIFADGYLTDDSPANDMDYIDIGHSDDHSRIYIRDKDDNRVYTAIGKLTEDGLFTVTVPWETGTKTYQYVCFYCDKDGLILADGSNTYYFTDRDRNSSQLGNNFSYEQISKLENIQEEKLAEIIEKRANLLDDLAVAYENAGLAVTVNRQTGEIMLDSAVLFAVDESIISDDGKNFLQQFMKIYTDTVFNEKYNGFISKILVEGHTDSTGEYEHNQVLSLDRAESVMNYCLSAECGVTNYTQQLTDMMLAEGYACDQLIYDADGNEDMDASRRVTFRFLINLD